jgi:preprotein translocase subunit YajC
MVASGGRVLGVAVTSVVLRRGRLSWTGSVNLTVRVRRPTVKRRAVMGHRPAIRDTLAPDGLAGAAARRSSAGRTGQGRRVGEVSAAILLVLLAKAGGAGSYVLLLYIVAVVAVFYLLLVRPQRRRRRVQQQMLSGIQKGDEIVTVDGIIGTVRRVRDRFVVVEVADHKQVRLLRSAVSQIRSRVDSPADGQ